MKTPPPFRVPLYSPGAIPNRRESPEEETQRHENGVLLLSKVQEPDITVYPAAPEKATGAAILICPGGGYQVLAYNWEGTDFARYWAAQGITGIVLKYRLPSPESQPTPHLTPLLDGQRALRLIRDRAAEWKLDPGKIGVMGFSAGGHLASTLCTQFDDGNSQSADSIEQKSSRPDFSLLIYPVISLSSPCLHRGCRDTLLGNAAPAELEKAYSSDQRVTPETPPAFISQAIDDTAVPFEHSLRYFQALQQNKVSASLHLYPEGGHGYGLAQDRPYLKTWVELCHAWVRATTA